MELLWEFESYGSTYWKYNNFIVEIKTGEGYYEEYSIMDISPNTIVNNFTNSTNGGFLIDISQGGIPRRDIVSLKISNEIPDNYSISYDVSQLKDESVILYAVEDSESKYAVTIVPNSGGEIYFPQGSNRLFYDCSSIKELDLTNVNTSNVVNMQHMFYGCTSLESINVSGFDTSNVTKMSTMFYNCSSLQTLDLSSFNTSKVQSMQSMFRENINLKTIYIGSGWNSNNADTTDMLKNCGTSELTLK